MKMLQASKTPEQISAMREGGKILAQILSDLKNFVHAGLSEKEIDTWVGEQIEKHGATPTYKEPKVNFPGNICISVNQQIVHSIPTDNILNKGDVVSFDLTITYKGMKTDSAITVVVDEEAKGAKKMLLRQTERALFAGIEQVKPGARVGDISSAIEKVLQKAGLGIVRELVGHGVGQDMHMPPEIPNYGRAGTGPILSVGDTLAIEPMSTLGSEKIKTDRDGWSIVTADSSLSAHFEHTVLVTPEGYEILTLL